MELICNDILPIPLPHKKNVWLVSKELPLGELEETTGTRTPLYYEWRLANRTWNPTTSPWIKQTTSLWIVHSGDWCRVFGATQY